MATPDQPEDEKSENPSRLPPEDEIERLKQKYRRHRIPPIVHSEKGKGDGLLDPKTLGILQQGFHIHETSPLAVLFADPDTDDPQKKWRGDPETFHHPRKHWIRFCNTLRVSPEANRRCEFHDREQAEHLEREEIHEAKAFMCPHGLIDFAYPVWIEKRLIAVLFTGQRFVKENTLWPVEMLAHKWFTPSQASGPDTGIDLYSRSIELFEQAQRDYFPGDGQKLRDSRKQDLKNPHLIVAPKDVVEYILRFKELGDQISRLAEIIIRDEKAQLRRHYRNKIESLLQLIIETPRDLKRFNETLLISAKVML